MTYKNHAAKIGEKTIIYEEYKKSLFLKSIDPRERYGIYARGFSSTGGHDLLMLEKTRGANTCHTLKKDKDVVYTIYDKFDMNLDTLLAEHFDSLSTLTWKRYILSLWKGLAFYHKHKFIHADIKEQNIAYVKNSGLYFTDFDWSKHLKSCADVDDQLIEMTAAVTGRPYEYWTSLLTSKYDQCDDKLLYYNDVYGLSVVCIKIFKKLAITSEKCYDALQLCKKIKASKDTSISAYAVFRRLERIL